MNDLFDQFIQTKIGLDLTQCDEQEIETLGQIYHEHYEPHDVRKKKNFYQYYLDAYPQWQILIYDKQRHLLNAYTPAGIKKEYPEIKLISSAEMLAYFDKEDINKDINKDELEKVFD